MNEWVPTGLVEWDGFFTGKRSSGLRHGYLLMVKDVGKKMRVVMGKLVA